MCYHDHDYKNLTCYITDAVTRDASCNVQPKGNGGNNDDTERYAAATAGGTWASELYRRVRHNVQLLDSGHHAELIHCHSY